MTVNFGLADGLQYASFLANAIILSFWLKERIVMNDFLAGRWEGVLTPNENSSVAYHCILYVTRHKGKDNTGHLYYYKQDLKSDDIPVKGLDTLVEYNDETFVFGKTWSPRFMRVFHKEGLRIMPSPDPIAEESSAFPPVYDWNCIICSFIFSAKMAVTICIAGESLKFSGFLRKD